MEQTEHLPVWVRHCLPMRANQHVKNVGVAPSYSKPTRFKVYKMLPLQVTVGFGCPMVQYSYICINAWQLNYKLCLPQILSEEVPSFLFTQFSRSLNSFSHHFQRPFCASLEVKQMFKKITTIFKFTFQQSEATILTYKSRCSVS